MPQVGRRIHVIGNSGSGKSTLGAALAEATGGDFVELDALNFEPGWIGLNEHDPAEFERRIGVATAGESWVAAGSYSKFSRKVFWPRLDSVVWLDLPLRTLVWRILRRSFRRWWSRELLWGTNYESIWTTLALWNRESLLRWIVTQHHRKKREMHEAMADPRWKHIQFVRIGSVEEALALVERARAERATTQVQ